VVHNIFIIRPTREVAINEMMIGLPPQEHDFVRECHVPIRSVQIDCVQSCCSSDFYLTHEGYQSLRARLLIFRQFHSRWLEANKGLSDIQPVTAIAGLGEIETRKGERNGGQVGGVEGALEAVYVVAAEAETAGGRAAPADSIRRKPAPARCDAGTS